MDRSLHPQLTYKFVEEFLKLANKRNIQLVITTHEARLLDFGLVRQDEIWISNKNTKGETELYSSLKILKYIDDHIEHYNTVENIANKITDYCFENLEIKENDIYNMKALYDDILIYLCSKYNLENNSEFELTSDILKDLCDYLDDKINILDQIENIQKYIIEQEIIYNKDIDKIYEH